MGASGGRESVSASEWSSCQDELYEISYKDLLEKEVDAPLPAVFRHRFEAETGLCFGLICCVDLESEQQYKDIVSRILLPDGSVFRAWTSDELCPSTVPITFLAPLGLQSDKAIAFGVDRCAAMMSSLSRNDVKKFNGDQFAVVLCGAVPVGGGKRRAFIRVRVDRDAWAHVAARSGFLQAGLARWAAYHKHSPIKEDSSFPIELQLPETAAVAHEQAQAAITGEQNGDRDGPDRLMVEVGDAPAAPAPALPPLGGGDLTLTTASASTAVPSQPPVGQQSAESTSPAPLAQLPPPATDAPQEGGPPN